MPRGKGRCHRDSGEAAKKYMNTRSNKVSGENHLLLCVDGKAQPIMVISPIVEPDDQTELNGKELRELKKCRQQLERHQKGFNAYVAALNQIRNQKLFREKHSSFARFVVSNGIFRPLTLAQCADEDIPGAIAGLEVPRSTRSPSWMAAGKGNTRNANASELSEAAQPEVGQSKGHVNN
jgi:hypothetical protein